MTQSGLRLLHGPLTSDADCYPGHLEQRSQARHGGSSHGARPGPASRGCYKPPSMCLARLHRLFDDLYAGEAFRHITSRAQLCPALPSWLPTVIRLNTEASCPRNETRNNCSMLCRLLCRTTFARSQLQHVQPSVHCCQPCIRIRSQQRSQTGELAHPASSPRRRLRRTLSSL